MAPSQAMRVATEPDSRRQFVQSLAFLVGILIGVGLASGFAAAAFPHSARSSVVCSGERINPNDAPLASLIRLPGVGLTRARAIVAYRDRIHAQPGHPSAFTTFDDLQEIKGIGPAIVNGVRPWLQLGDASIDIDAVPAK